MEELQARHRKELRDLQSRVTQKKKAATKKTRKGVNDECAALEAELKQRQDAEVAALSGVPPEANGELRLDALEQLDLEDGSADVTQKEVGSTQLPAGHPPAPEDPEEAATPSQTRKPNRQKARLARRAAEQEEVAKQAAAEAKDIPDLKQQERDKMLAEFKKRGLREQVIRADGHCLYSAVADQLEQLGMPVGTEPGGKPALAYKTVRAKAADYIESHPDDFAPFLEEPLPEYLHKVRDTGEWGGQLELMALAKSYGVEIDVLQGDGRVEKIEPEQNAGEKSIWLGYYKHGFGLGEHYNSLRKVPRRVE